MPKIAYEDRRFHASSRRIIAEANAIIGEYAAQGFSLTLRQLYYQFVARDLMPNRQSEYKRLGGIVSDARMAGLIDWYAIEDRTRFLRSLSHWESAEEIIDNAAQGFALDKWADQPHRLEVWIEKDALVGVIEGVCNENDVPYFSCRGYTSQSEMWRAAMRLQGYMIGDQQEVRILHLGDHDPSGIDMTRDIEDRLDTFLGPYVGLVDRVALNMDQVEEHGPPPNPAKITDSRYRGYVIEHGPDSWELDALDPPTLAALIETYINRYRDETLWTETIGREDEIKAQLSEVSNRWDEITEEL